MRLLAMATLVLAAGAVSAQPARMPNAALLGRPDYTQPEAVLAKAWAGRLATLAPACGKRDAAWGQRLLNYLGSSAAGPAPDGAASMFASDATARRRDAYFTQASKADGAAMMAAEIGRDAYARQGAAACTKLFNDTTLAEADPIAGPTPPGSGTATPAPNFAPPVVAAAQDYLTGLRLVACGMRPTTWWQDLQNAHSGGPAVALLAAAETAAPGRASSGQQAVGALNMLDFGGRRMLALTGSAACEGLTNHTRIATLDEAAARGRACRTNRRDCWADVKPVPRALN